MISRSIFAKGYCFTLRMIETSILIMHFICNPSGGGQPAPIEPRKSTYPQWVKSDPVRHKVKALPLLPTTTTKIGIFGPTPSRFPAQRTSLVGNRVEPTSLLPWLEIEPRPNESGRKYFIKK